MRKLTRTTTLWEMGIVIAAIVSFCGPVLASSQDKDKKTIEQYYKVESADFNSFQEVDKTTAFSLYLVSFKDSSKADAITISKEGKVLETVELWPANVDGSIYEAKPFISQFNNRIELLDFRGGDGDDKWDVLVALDRATGLVAKILEYVSSDVFVMKSNERVMNLNLKAISGAPNYSIQVHSRLDDGCPAGLLKRFNAEEPNATNLDVISVQLRLADGGKISIPSCH